MKMLNKPNPQIEKIVINEISRFFQDSDTNKNQWTVEIIREKAFIKTNERKDIGRYVENVIIKTLDKKMKKTISSFKAQIDSETGEIYQTWDKKIRY
jgi:hypothetical protein